MNKSALFLPLLLVAGGVHAQDSSACPQLAPDTGLSWEYRGGGGADFCRALRADGSEAFGMYISRDPAFSPKRGNRKEVDTMGGREVQWYSAELAGQPGVEARETLVTLNDGRTAHVWVQAASNEQLQQTFALTRNLDFTTRSASLTSNGQ